MTPELLSPAGGLEAALAAFQYGADAVYLGLPRFSARADADNVTPERVRALLAYARSFTPAKKVYVTFNTLVQDTELTQAIDALDTLDDLAPDGVIVQDLGVAHLIRDAFPRLALHASTQLAAHNLDGVLALKDLGFTRVVLARELTLDEVRAIVRASGVEIEIFIHGALCYSYSGLCLFSSHAVGRSGNRGRCAYCCREPFEPVGGRPSSAAPYPFSMRDLALAPMLKAVADTGAQSLKIEGRMKSPLYVACVTDYYRRKLDNHLTPEAERCLVQDLQTIFSRPWTSLYAEGTAPDARRAANGKDTAVIDPLAVGHRGAPIGKVETVFRDRNGARWVRFSTSRELEKHDGLQIERPGGGPPFGFAVDRLRVAATAKTLIVLPAGLSAEVELPSDAPPIPPGATVFCSASQAVRRRYVVQNLRESALVVGHPAGLHVRLAPDGIAVRAETAFDRPGDVAAETVLPCALTPARQPEQTEPAVRKAFERLGDTAWRPGALTLDDPQALYAPASKLNEARRAVFERLTAVWSERRAERRAAIAETWGLGAPSERHPLTPHRTLKLRLDTPPLTDDALTEIDTLVLAVGHAPDDACERALAAWTAVFPRERIRLALPPLTRAPTWPALKNQVGTRVRNGWTNWECADLAGHRLLAEAGIVPASADWTLYAFNRVAAAELARLGIGSYVLSPENSLENMLSLPTGDRYPIPELLIYQHTPLFLSATAPSLPSEVSESAVTLTDRRGRRFVTSLIDGVWTTVAAEAFCIADSAADTGIARLRTDFSWSPEGTDVREILRLLRERRPLPNTHTANFTRGLA